jgi:hypothetical protein
MFAWPELKQIGQGFGVLGPAVANGNFSPAPFANNPFKLFAIRHSLEETYARSSASTYHARTAAWQTPDDRQRTEGGRCGAPVAMA